MPTPKKNETENEFISRCIPIVIKEKEKAGEELVEGQAFAICKNMWDKSKVKGDK